MTTAELIKMTLKNECIIDNYYSIIIKSSYI